MTAPTSSPFAAMIFAAGLGTRMGALTRDRPKPLIPVAGRPLLDHALALARDSGGHAGSSSTPTPTPAQVADHLARVAPRCRSSPTSPSGSRPAAACTARCRCSGRGRSSPSTPTWCGRGRNPLAALAAPGGRAWARCSASSRATGAVGHAGPGDFFLAADGRLTRRGAAETAPFVYAGAEIIDTAALDGFDEAIFSLNPVWDRLIAPGRLFGVVHGGGWVDVGRPEGIALAEAELAR